MPSAENVSIQTYRGVADAWECDQMKHMNVRFIAERFGRADSFLFAALDIDKIARASLRSMSEQLAFSKEILPGEPLLIESDCSYVPQSRVLDVRHLLTFAATGIASATALTRYDIEPCASLFGDHPAMRRRHRDQEADAIVSPEMVGDPQVPLQESGRTFLSATDYRDGCLRREAVVRLINHAASCAGLNRGRRLPTNDQPGIGSATLAIKWKRGAVAAPASCVQVMSSLKARSAKTVTIFHRILDLFTSEILTEAASTHVFFDIGSRTAIPIPSEVSPIVFWG